MKGEAVMLNLIRDEATLSHHRRKNMITTLIHHGDYSQGELTALYKFLFALSPDVDMDIRAVRNAVINRIASPLYNMATEESHDVS
jgi:hypothetical protein